MDGDESTKNAPASPRSSEPASGDPPGLRAQFAATLEAGRRLFRAHVDLAKTEIGEIVGEVKRMVALGAVALGALLMVVLVLVLGGLLFLGEWLFGSIGWGVLLGMFLFLDIAAIALLRAVDISGARLGMSLGIALIAGAVVGVVLGFDLTHRGWTALADSLVPEYDPETRAVLLAMGGAALVVGLLGFVSGIPKGAASSVGRLVAGALGGALLGLPTVISMPGTVGAALGVLVTLVAWPAVAGLDLLRAGVDGEALAKKFVPQQTIDLTKETIEWVRARTPLVPKS